MRYINLKSIVLGLILLFAAGVYSASFVPASATSEIEAEVITRTARSSPTGNIGILLCKLDSGSTVTVELPPHGKARKGDRIMLRSYDRYIFGAKYQFGGKLIE